MPEEKRDYSAVLGNLFDDEGKTAPSNSINHQEEENTAFTPVSPKPEEEHLVEGTDPLSAEPEAEELSSQDLEAIAGVDDENDEGLISAQNRLDDASNIEDEEKLTRNISESPYARTALVGGTIGCVVILSLFVTSLLSGGDESTIEETEEATQPENEEIFNETDRYKSQLALVDQAQAGQRFEETPSSVPETTEEEIENSEAEEDEPRQQTSTNEQRRASESSVNRSSPPPPPQQPARPEPEEANLPRAIPSSPAPSPAPRQSRQSDQPSPPESQTNLEPVFDPRERWDRLAQAGTQGGETSLTTPIETASVTSETQAENSHGQGTGGLEDRDSTVDNGTTETEVVNTGESNVTFVDRNGQIREIPHSDTTSTQGREIPTETIGDNPYRGAGQELDSNGRISLSERLEQERREKQKRERIFVTPSSNQQLEEQQKQTTQPTREEQQLKYQSQSQSNYYPHYSLNSPAPKMEVMPPTQLVASTSPVSYTTKPPTPIAYHPSQSDADAQLLAQEQMTPGEQGILERSRSRDFEREPIDRENLPTRREVALGTAVKGKVVVPIIASADGETLGRFSVELTKPLMSIDGKVALPAGTVLVTDVLTVNGSRAIQQTVVAVVYKDSKGKVRQEQVSPNVLLVRGKDGGALIAETEGGGGSSFTEDVLAGLVGAAGNTGAVLNRPNVSTTSTSTTGGDETSTSTTIETQEPSVLGAVLEGFFSSTSERLTESLEDNDSFDPVLVVESGEEVIIFVNGFLEILR